MEESDELNDILCCNFSDLEAFLENIVQLWLNICGKYLREGLVEPFDDFGGHHNSDFLLGSSEFGNKVICG